MKKVKRSLCVAVTLAALGALARADTVDYNTPGDLAAKFKLNNQTGTGGFVQVDTGGIGNSGAVDITAGPASTQDVTAIYNVQSYDLNNGPIRLSQAVKVATQYTNGDRLLQLGLIDDLAANHQLNGGTPAVADFISGRIFPTAAPAAGATTGPFVWQVQAGQSTAGAATATSNGPNSAAFNLILGDWYQFTVDITKNATPNSFTLTGTLQDLGADGLTPGATMTFGPEPSPTTNTAEIYNDTTVYGSYRGHFSTGGADLYDNFSITQPVPEPASMLALAAVGALGLIRRRRA
jgi:hypothetical protein